MQPLLQQQYRDDKILEYHVLTIKGPERPAGMPDTLSAVWWNLGLQACAKFFGRLLCAQSSIHELEPQTSQDPAS